MRDRVQTITGTVEFIWETDGELLLNLEPDRPDAPHTFEVGGRLRDRLGDSLGEGDLVEVDFMPVAHEIVDPDGGPTDGVRAEVHDVRVVHRR